MGRVECEKATGMNGGKDMADLVKIAGCELK